jgi:predicted phage tail component-like protein
MYDFIDTNEHTSTTSLPAEAVSIDGTYLENIVSGYRTLYVSGRESLAPELNTYSVGVADGEKVKNRRYPARTLTVGFQLLAPNAEEFRARFNQLNNVLAKDEADFIFNDETDKYFTGYPIMNTTVDPGLNTVTGEWEIYCAYPFKRSVDTVTLTTDDATGVVVEGNKATFTIDYDGMLPAKPLLRAEFASAETDGSYNEDGDCGFVAFVNDEEDIIQLGNPEATDIDPLNKNATLINHAFNSLTGWTINNIALRNISDQYWNKGKGQNLKYAFGTGSLKKTTVGGVNFNLNVVHRLSVENSTQKGSFKCLLKSGNNTVTGFTIEKNGNGYNGTVKYIIDGRTVGTATIDLSRFNTNFGFCDKLPVYTTQRYHEVIKTVRRSNGKKFRILDPRWTVRKVVTGWTYTQSNLNSSIVRNDEVVTFKVGNLPQRTFKSSDIAGVPFYDMVFEFSGNITYNAVRSCALIKKAGVAFADIPNVFTAGDIVEADCNSANVWLYRNGSADGTLAPQYGALGNDWETFDLHVGTNTIVVTWSDWVNENYKPHIEIEYNKVFL